MIVSFLNELLAAVVGMLPRLFLIGAPFLLIGILVAALIDTKLPATASHAPRRSALPRRESPAHRTRTEH